MTPAPELQSGALKRAAAYQPGGLGFAKLAATLLRGGTPVRFRASGFSMTPSIDDGDVVVVSPLSGVRPAVGDIVAFLRDDDMRLVVHRIVSRDAGGVTTRGDNATEADGVVAAGRIVGVVSLVERAGDSRVPGGVFPAWLIARMVRAGLLRRLNGIWNLPRRPLSTAFARARALKLYRWIGGLMSGRVTIGELTPREFTEFHRSGGPTVGTEKPGSPNGYLGAWRSGKLVAVLEILTVEVAHSGPVDPWLFGVLVRPRFRGLGIGERLCREALERLCAAGAQDVRLLVDRSNVAAVRLYEKIGFVDVEASRWPEWVTARARALYGAERFMSIQLRGRIPAGVSSDVKEVRGRETDRHAASVGRDAAPSDADGNRARADGALSQRLHPLLHQPSSGRSGSEET